MTTKAETTFQENTAFKLRHPVNDDPLEEIKLEWQMDISRREQKRNLHHNDFSFSGYPDKDGERNVYRVL